MQASELLLDVPPPVVDLAKLLQTLNRTSKQKTPLRTQVYSCMGHVEEGLGLRSVGSCLLG